MGTTFLRVRLRTSPQLQSPTQTTTPPNSPYSGNHRCPYPNLPAPPAPRSPLARTSGAPWELLSSDTCARTTAIATTATDNRTPNYTTSKVSQQPRFQSQTSPSPAPPAPEFLPSRTNGLESSVGTDPTATAASAAANPSRGPSKMTQHLSPPIPIPPPLQLPHLPTPSHPGPT